MIVESFYLSDETNLDRAIELTGLSFDELFGIVGRFTKHSWRSGQMRGEVILKSTGEVVIRHHFTKKALWRGESLAGFEEFDERL